MSFSASRPPRYTLIALAALCLPLSGRAQNSAPPAPVSPNGTKPPAASASPNAANPPAASAPPTVTPEIKQAIAQFQAAAKFQQARKVPQAIAAYREFLRLGAKAKFSESMMQPAYDNLYRLCQAAQDTKGMEFALGHLAGLMPQNPGIQVEYALLYLGQKRFDEAGKCADKALALKPPAVLAAQAHFVRGAVAHVRKQWAVAEKEYAASDKLVPGNPQAQFNLLLAQNEQKKTGPAIKTAEKLLKSSPRMVPAWMLLATLRQQAKDLPGAIAAYNGVLKIEPKNEFGAVQSRLTGSAIAARGRRHYRVCRFA